MKKSKATDLPSERARKKLMLAAARLARAQHREKLAKLLVKKWSKKAALYEKRLASGYYKDRDVVERMKRAIGLRGDGAIPQEATTIVAGSATIRGPIRAKKILMGKGCLSGYHSYHRMCDGKRNTPYSKCHCACHDRSKEKPRRETTRRRGRHFIGRS